VCGRKKGFPAAQLPYTGSAPLVACPPPSDQPPFTLRAPLLRTSIIVVRDVVANGAWMG
jgi:hypothetical protein